MIRLKAVSKSYDNMPVLKNISFEIQAGERVSILGPGGCGKSTLLKLILGLTMPDAGSVHLHVWGSCELVLLVAHDEPGAARAAGAD